MRTEIMSLMLVFGMTISMISCGVVSNSSASNTSSNIADTSEEGKSSKKSSDEITNETSSDDSSADIVETVEIEGDHFNCSPEEFADLIMSNYVVQVTKSEFGTDTMDVYRFSANDKIDVKYATAKNDQGKLSFVTILDSDDEATSISVAEVMCSIIDPYFNTLNENELREIVYNHYFEHDGLILFGTENKKGEINYSFCTVDEYQNNFASIDEENDKSGISITQQYYNLTLTLTKNDCTKDSLGIYSYNGFSFTSEESEWLDSSLNKKGKINANAFYIKLAKCLAGFEYGNSWESYAPYILGYTPDSREDFAEMVDDLSSFIVESDAAIAIIEKLKTV